MSKKTYVGIVVSDKMQKTRIVRITRMSKHAKYGRIAKVCTKFKFHDEKEISHVGDEVKIVETRPLSKDKRYNLVEITKKLALPNIEIKDDAK